MARSANSPKPIWTGDRPDGYTFEKSGFWKTLVKCKGAEGDTLRAAVRRVVESAGAICGQVAADMPFYTDHGEKHLKNVLWIMDGLVTPKGRAQLGPLGSALCIMAAYVHDLGMTLTQAERESL